MFASTSAPATGPRRRFLCGGSDSRASCSLRHATSKATAPSSQVASAGKVRNVAPMPDTHDLEERFVAILQTADSLHVAPSTKRRLLRWMDANERGALFLKDWYPHMRHLARKGNRDALRAELEAMLGGDGH